MATPSAQSHTPNSSKSPEGLESLATPQTVPLPGSARKRWAKADRAERAELIMLIGLELLRERGAEAVTIRKVADRLGVGAMTLYTYIDGQDGLRRAMIRRGFELLHHNCCQASTLGNAHGWKGGAMAYLRFAHDHPNLYKLMFNTPLPDTDQDLLSAGFSGLLDRVRQRLADAGHDPATLEREALDQAGRFWISLHGLASLAIAKRLGTLERDLDELLDDLLERVSPE